MTPRQLYDDEIEVQQKALRDARGDAEVTAQRLADLYDFAPAAFMTLGDDGIIRDLNFTAANWFGQPRHFLINLPFVGLVVPESRATYFAFLRENRLKDQNQDQDQDVTTDLGLRTANGIRVGHLACRRRRSPDDSSLEFLVAIVDVTERQRLERERARLADERAALAVRAMSVQDEERHRIARNLHDNLGQQITGLRLMVDVLAAADGPPNAHVRRLQAQVRALDVAIEEAVSELRPECVDLGLPTALSHLATQWSDTVGIPVHLSVDNRDALTRSRATDTHAYRVAQEALNNIAKHAHASTVTIRLDRRSDQVVLTISDDGDGFSSDDKHGGLGLVSMRERAQLAGGTLAVESGPGQGTTITLRVPCDTPVEGDAPLQSG